MKTIMYKVEPQLNAQELSELFASAWGQSSVSGGSKESNYIDDVLSRSLTYICAFSGQLLVGFVNVAWDGGGHGFLLDTTVRSDYQREGIGTELVKRAIDVSKERGLEWLHVDFEPHLKTFYRKCGFLETDAGLVSLWGAPSALAHPSGAADPRGGSGAKGDEPSNDLRRARKVPLHAGRRLGDQSAEYPLFWAY